MATLHNRRPYTCIQGDWGKGRAIDGRNIYFLFSYFFPKHEWHLCTVYSVIDLAGAFWQLPVDPDSKEKTAFVVQSGQYLFNHMPFGLRNAPASFQKLIADIFRGLTYKTMIGFIDDMICFSPNVDQHMKDLQEIFHRLRQAYLKAKPTKCIFATNSVKYLGHIPSSKEVLPNPKQDVQGH